MTEVVTKSVAIIEPIGAFFVSTLNNEVIHQTLLVLNVLQGLNDVSISNRVVKPLKSCTVYNATHFLDIKEKMRLFLKNLGRGT